MHTNNITLKIVNSPSPIIQSTYSVCNSIKNKLKNEDPDADIDSIEVSGGIDKGTGIGCKVTTIKKSGEDWLWEIEKVLWYPQNANKTI